jgi:hypothetical protein
MQAQALAQAQAQDTQDTRVTIQYNFFVDSTLRRHRDLQNNFFAGSTLWRHCAAHLATSEAVTWLTTTCPRWKRNHIYKSFNLQITHLQHLQRISTAAKSFELEIELWKEYCLLPYTLAEFISQPVVPISSVAGGDGTTRPRRQARTEILYFYKLQAHYKGLIL